MMVDFCVGLVYTTYKLMASLHGWSMANWATTLNLLPEYGQVKDGKLSQPVQQARTARHDTRGIERHLSKA